MKLSQLLEGISVLKMFQTMYGKMVVTHDVEISGIAYDSRTVERGNIFVALKGVASDGHRFLQSAIDKGAKVLVVQDDNSIPDSFCMHAGVVKIVVENTRKVLAQLSANYYHHPTKKLQCIGVTGTNGKTTTTFLLKQLLEKNPKHKVGLIGTVEYHIGDEKISATHTTPESLELQKLFSQMVEKQCTHVVMEVSSHALHQYRVYGIEFAAAVFTNLTQDHLDYHNTMEEYFSAKKIFFDSLTEKAIAVSNGDAEYGEKIIVNTKAKKVFYGIHSSADVVAKNILLTINGFQCEVDGKKIQTSLVGKFNIYNFLAAYTTVIKLGYEIENSTIQSLQPAPGRFEQFHSPQGWLAIVDYAHTPDGFKNCLQAIHDILPKNRNNKIYIIFGAGGDRDKTKRPLMGAIAEQLSDVVVITEDNPRTENLQVIIDDICRGIQNREKIIIEVDRRKAIEKTLSLARSGDVVLLAGKGHENYQIIGKEKHYFSDKEIVKEYIAKHV